MTLSSTENNTRWHVRQKLAAGVYGPMTNVTLRAEDLRVLVGALDRLSMEQAHSDKLEELLVRFGSEPGPPHHLRLYSELRRIFPKKDPPKKLPGQVAYEAHVASMPGDVRELLADFHAAHSSTRTTYERIEAAVLATKAG